MDEYFQTTNFDSLLNVDGAKNWSEFTLQLPLLPNDINRLYQFDSHLHCVSFGKKLKIMIDHYRYDSPVSAGSRSQVRKLVQNVTRIWQLFEHLEIQQTPATFERPYVGYNANDPFVEVPFGDIVDHDLINKIRLWEQREQNETSFYYSPFSPDDFRMFIPFLQHLTHLKTITFLIQDKRQICHILLRLPKICQLERIFIGGNLRETRATWFKLLPLVFTKCYKNLNFLSGCDLRMLETLASKDHNRVFENLEELHVTISSSLDLDSMQRFIDNGRATKLLFPNVLVLQVRVDSVTVTFNSMEIFYHFAKQFHSLRHFSLSGNCVAGQCINIKKLHSTAHLRRLFVGQCSRVSTFQIECSSHIPVDLMQMFPSLNRIILAEQPGRCRGRQSRASDWNYIKKLFDLFEPGVRQITFVPSVYIQPFAVLSLQPGVITRNRNEQRCNSRKRKR